MGYGKSEEMKTWSKGNEEKLLRVLWEVMGNEGKGSKTNKKWDSMANE